MLKRLGVNLIPLWFFQRCVFVFVTFNIIVTNIFLIKFNEIYQVILKIWRFSWSIFTIFIDFSDFLMKLVMSAYKRLCQHFFYFIFPASFLTIFCYVFQVQRERKRERRNIFLKLTSRFPYTVFVKIIEMQFPVWTNLIPILFHKQNLHQILCVKIDLLYLNHLK